MIRRHRSVGAHLMAIFCLAGALQSSVAEAIGQRYAFGEHGGLRL